MKYIKYFENKNDLDEFRFVLDVSQISKRDNQDYIEKIINSFFEKFSSTNGSTKFIKSSDKNPTICVLININTWLNEYRLNYGIVTTPNWNYDDMKSYGPIIKFEDVVDLNKEEITDLIYKLKMDWEMKKDAGKFGL